MPVTPELQKEIDDILALDDEVKKLRIETQKIYYAIPNFTVLLSDHKDESVVAYDEARREFRRKERNFLAQAPALASIIRQLQAELAARDAWSDMSTAPKNTPILVRGSRLVTCAGDGGKLHPLERPVIAQCDEWDDMEEAHKNNWYLSDDSYGDKVFPTEWQPLPKAALEG